MNILLNDFAPDNITVLKQRNGHSLFLISTTKLLQCRWANDWISDRFSGQDGNHVTDNEQWISSIFEPCDQISAVPPVDLRSISTTSYHECTQWSDNGCGFQFLSIQWYKMIMTNVGDDTTSCIGSWEMEGVILKWKNSETGWYVTFSE